MEVAIYSPYPEINTLHVEFGNMKIWVHFQPLLVYTLIAKFMGTTWGPPGANRTQVGPMLATWTLLSGQEDKNVASIQGQYRVCWWPGDARSQDISSNNIARILSEHSGLSTDCHITGKGDGKLNFQWTYTCELPMICVYYERNVFRQCDCRWSSENILRLMYKCRPGNATKQRYPRSKAKIVIPCENNVHSSRKYFGSLSSVQNVEIFQTETIILR